MNDILPAVNRICQRGRGLQFYTGFYGRKKTDDRAKDDVYAGLDNFSRTIVSALVKELGTHPVPFTKGNISWLAAVQYLVNGDIDLILDPIFLTPSRERDLEVVQYGTLEKYCVVAWTKSRAYKELLHVKEIIPFLTDHNIKIGVYENTAAAEEIQQAMMTKMFGHRWFPMPLSDLIQWFCGIPQDTDFSSEESQKIKNDVWNRVIICDVGIRNYINSKISQESHLKKEFGSLHVWELPYVNLKRYYGARGGIPAGIAFRRNDSEWGQILYNIFYRECATNGVYKLYSKELIKNGIKPFLKDQLKPPVPSKPFTDEYNNVPRLDMPGIHNGVTTRVDNINMSSSTSLKQDPNFINFVAYQNEMNHLLSRFSGQYVAYHNGSRIELGPDEDYVYKEARKRVPRGIILIQRIVPKGQLPSGRLRTLSFGWKEKKEG